MAKTRVLLLLLLVVADGAAAAAATPKLSTDAQEAITKIYAEVGKITNALVSAAPPDKQRETMQAVQKHLQLVTSALDKAKESGDEKQILRLFFTVKVAAVSIDGAPPDKKLKIMEDEFNAVAAPSGLDCPNVDNKAFCEMHSKIKKAMEGVLAAAPPDVKKSDEVKITMLQKIMYPAGSTINKAYADGDKKKMDQVLAAYTKAAEEVIAAAPADKLKVMEKTFAAAGN